jgi:hypothetical protein
LVSASASASAPASVTGIPVDTNPDRYPVYVPYVSA